jgi:hypothetical protein
MQVSGNAYSSTMCHIQAFNGTTGVGQGQEVFMDYYLQLPSGAFHTSAWGLQTSNVWNSGPEIDVLECFAINNCEQNYFDGSETTHGLPGIDRSAALHQYGADISNSTVTFFVDGSSVASQSNGNSNSTIWYPLMDSTVDATSGTLVFPTTSLWDYSRVFKHVSSGACYTSIPGPSTIPHTGTC